MPLAELRRVTKTYRGPPPFTALQETSLRIWQGDFLSVVGPSGSGKSTLLNILGLLDVPTSGDYLIEGRHVGRLGENALTDLRGSSIGFVFQSFHLMPHRTALENVALAGLYAGQTARVRVSRAMECLESVGLTSKINSLPSALSGGEKQRVALARALAGRPRLLLCDEPTGALDQDNGRRVMESIATCNAAGVTVVLITHDTEIAARAGRAVRIVDGRVHDAR